MKILVPTDFTKASFSVFRYATQLAYDFNAEITLLHVVDVPSRINDSVLMGLVRSTFDRALQQLKYFAGAYPNSKNIEIKQVPLNYEIRFGSPGFTIVDYASDCGFDLIIMGTRDRHSILEKILGTASSTVIRFTKKPVLLIPLLTSYKMPEKLVFGFDNKGELNTAIDAFHQFNSIIGASVDFVHVKRGEKENLTQSKSEIVEELIINNRSDYALRIKELEADNVEEELARYCVSEEADILTLIHREEGILDSMLNRSHSVKLAWNLGLPLLVFNQNQEFAPDTLNKLIKNRL